MAEAIDVLRDGFGRVAEEVARVLEGLDGDVLNARVDPSANTVSWLVWHLTRVQDDHVAEVAGLEQVWSSAGFRDRFGLPVGGDATGYGMSADEVAAVRIDDPALLADYHRAVHDATASFLDTLSSGDLDRVVDERWDPPVTLAARLVSVLSDDLQHVGQAAFARGVLERRTAPQGG